MTQELVLGTSNSDENQALEVIIRPQGPQGPGMALRITSKNEYKAFDEAVGKLPEDQQNNIERLIEIARDMGLRIAE